MASEVVYLADGQARQGLIPGVTPSPAFAREMAAERRRREQRHGHAPLPTGGLFDETAIAQQDLF